MLDLIIYYKFCEKKLKLNKEEEKKCKESQKERFRPNLKWYHSFFVHMYIVATKNNHKLKPSYHAFIHRTGFRTKWLGSVWLCYFNGSIGWS